MYKICPNCGFMYDDVSSVCPSCQSNNAGEVSATQEQNTNNQPYSHKNEKKKKDKNVISKKLVITISAAVAALVVFFVAGFAIYLGMEAKSQEEYNAYFSDEDFNEFDETDDFLENNDTIAIENIEFIDYETNSILSDIYDSGELNKYGPRNVIDFSDSTCWAEGESGFGQGCFIKLYCDEVAVSEIYITNGYCKSKEIFYKNNRVKEMKISFSDGTEKNVVLSSEYGEHPDHIVLDKPIETTYIKFEIVSVYEGSAYDDTCISEIAVSGYRQNE